MDPTLSGLMDRAKGDLRQTVQADPALPGLVRKLGADLVSGAPDACGVPDDRKVGTRIARNRPEVRLDRLLKIALFEGDVDPLMRIAFLGPDPIARGSCLFGLSELWRIVEFSDAWDDVRNTMIGLIVNYLGLAQHSLGRQAAEIWLVSLDGVCIGTEALLKIDLLGSEGEQ